MLVDATVLVTGASSGIGRACAEAFARAGARLLLCARRGDRLTELADSLDAEVRTLPLDVRDRAAVSAAVDGLDDGWRNVDVLVNNAGLQHITPVHEFPVDRFSLILRVMLEAPFRLVRRTLPHMYEGGWGRVVNVSSAHGLRASAYKSAYVTAKHGLEGLSKVVALEGAEHGVTSNCVNPAYVRTPLVEQQISDQARSHGISEDEVLERVMLEPVAVKRLIEPEEVAEMVAFLCTPETSFVTGASLTMDGAATAQW